MITFQGKGCMAHTIPIAKAFSNINHNAYLLVSPFRFFLLTTHEHAVPMFFLFVCLFVEYVFVFTMPRLICSHWWVETSSSFLLIYCNVKKGVRPLWCSSCWEDIAFKSDVFISRVICVCVRAYRSVSDNEMLHVAKKYLEGNSAVFIRLMFHWVHLLLILFRDTKTWRQILIKKAHCVSLPGNTSAVCLFCSVWPIGMKNSIYTNTVYLSQQLTWWNPWKQPLVLRNTTPAKSKSYIKLWSLKKSFLL